MDRDVVERIYSASIDMDPGVTSLWSAATDEEREEAGSLMLATQSAEIESSRLRVAFYAFLAARQQRPDESMAEVIGRLSSEELEELQRIVDGGEPSGA